MEGAAGGLRGVGGALSSAFGGQGTDFGALGCAIPVWGTDLGARRYCIYMQGTGYCYEMVPYMALVGVWAPHRAIYLTLNAVIETFQHKKLVPEIAILRCWVPIGVP